MKEILDGPLDENRVPTNFRETHLTNLRVGDTATIRVDIYPGYTVTGKVLEIASASGSQCAAAAIQCNR